MNIQKLFLIVSATIIGLLFVSSVVYYFTSEKISEDGSVKSFSEKIEREKLTKTEKYEDEEFSFTYYKGNYCLSVDGKFLNNKEAEKYKRCFSTSVSKVTNGSPEESIMKLEFGRDPDSDGIYGKQCFSREKKILDSGYVVFYFENPEPDKATYREGCGYYPTYTEYGNFNIYFVVNANTNKFVSINDSNDTNNTTKIWELISSINFK
jgi:hypothetical protein